MSEKRPNEPAASAEMLREELSAFMDGELDADRTRFLLQRLRHDAELRARWERWQLLSASLRRQAQPLPVDFADRVASALDAEAVNAVPVRSRALRWAGGAALAASLAVAGVFVFDAMHPLQTGSSAVAATSAGIKPSTPVDAATRLATQSPANVVATIRRTALPLSEPQIEMPRIELPIPVHNGVVGTFRSPLRPVLVRQNRPEPQFSPFPQPFVIDPELAAYLEQQKSGNAHDPFARHRPNFPAAGDDSVRTVAYPQRGQH